MHTYHLRKKTVSGRDNWRKVSKEEFFEKREKLFDHHGVGEITINQIGFETPVLDGKIESRKMHKL